MRSQPLLHRYAVLTASATFFLLIAGGMVTSTDSGLAVPDWPLSYGTWFPPMVGGIFYEHGHRMIAAAVGLLILGLAIWLARVESRRWVKRLGVVALAGVMLQGVLGGLTVLLLLPPQISIAHACLGQTIFCLVVCLARATSPGWNEASIGWREAPSRAEDGEQRFVGVMSRLVAIAAAAQLLLGAILRHTGAGMIPHMIGASILVALAVVLIGSALRHRAICAQWRGQLVRLALLLAAQVALGLSVWGHRAVVPLRTAHVAIGALVLAQAVVLAWEISRQCDPAPSRRASGGRLNDYLELTKPRLSLLVLVTTGVGFWLGNTGRAWWPLLGHTLLGTWLVVAGANALNQWVERRWDGLMRRTADRPLPAGRLEPASAQRFGIGMAVLGLAYLALTVNGPAAALAAASLISYLFFYTPLKRLTSLCTLAGAVPGALPPVIGWAASRGGVGLEAWLLFALLYVWQLPHFLAIAVLYRDDYARAGFKMLPVTEPDGLMTAAQTALYGAALLPISLLPTTIGLAGGAYFFGALALGLGFLGLVAQAALRRSPASCRALFLASVLYLPLILGLLAWDRLPIG